MQPYSKTGKRTPKSAPTVSIILLQARKIITQTPVHPAQCSTTPHTRPTPYTRPSSPHCRFTTWTTSQEFRQGIPNYLAPVYSRDPHMASIGNIPSQERLIGSSAGNFMQPINTPSTALMEQDEELDGASCQHALSSIACHSNI